MASVTADGSPKAHCLFDGTPEKVSTSRIRDAYLHGRSVFKGRFINFDDPSDKKLREGDIYVSSNKLQGFMKDDQVSVIVVEGLLLFEKPFNSALESVFRSKDELAQDSIRFILELAAAGSTQDLRRAYELMEQKDLSGVSPDDLDMLSRVKQAARQTAHKDTLTFSGLACGITLALKDEDDDGNFEVKCQKEQLLSALKEHVLSVFKEVLDVMDETDDDPELRRLCRNPKEALAAFSELFNARMTRNTISHPFSSPQVGKVQRVTNRACDALVILKENQHRFPELKILLAASVPFLEKYIQDARVKMFQTRQKADTPATLSAKLDSLGFLCSSPFDRVNL